MYLLLSWVLICLLQSLYNELSVSQSRNSRDVTLSHSDVLRHGSLNELVLSPVSSEDDLDKGWRSRLLAHRFELLIASCVAVAVTLVLGIGLGGEQLSGNLFSDNGGSVARTDCSINVWWGPYMLHNSDPTHTEHLRSVWLSASCRVERRDETSGFIFDIRQWVWRQTLQIFTSDQLPVTEKHSNSLLKPKNKIQIKFQIISHLNLDTNPRMHRWRSRFESDLSSDVFTSCLFLDVVQ